MPPPRQLLGFTPFDEESQIMPMYLVWKEVKAHALT
tara:strand:+ start:858 stop:965 length:108 start_codon:yes stop_codon:yes gene_type:complete